MNNISFSIDYSRPSARAVVRCVLLLCLAAAIHLTKASPVVAIVAGLLAISESFTVTVSRPNNDG